jgi:hypothetical protein
VNNFIITGNTMAAFLNLGQIGNLNYQGIQIAHSIDAHIGKLAEDPDTRNVADALKELTQAIGAEAALADEQRRELLEQLELLGEQARAPAEQRKRGIIKPVIDTLAGVCTGAGGLVAVWTTWGPAIKLFFGIR